MIELRFKNQSNLVGCMVQAYVDPVDAMLFFDRLPPRIREAINDSPYKLCCNCIRDAYRRLDYDEEMTLGEIYRMEAMIRSGECYD